MVCFVAFLLPPFWDSPLCLITEGISGNMMVSYSVFFHAICTDALNIFLFLGCECCCCVNSSIVYCTFYSRKYIVCLSLMKLSSKYLLVGKLIKFVKILWCVWKIFFFQNSSRNYKIQIDESFLNYLKGTLMQIWESHCMFVFMYKQYPENFAFLIRRILVLFTMKFVNFLKSRLIFNIFYISECL